MNDGEVNTLWIQLLYMTKTQIFCFEKGEQIVAPRESVADLGQ